MGTRTVRRRLVVLVTGLVLLAIGPAPAAAFQTVSLTSDLLSRFWGMPMPIRAKVFVPRRCRRATSPCAVMYHLPYYGGFRTPWTTLGDFAALSARFPSLAMAHVLLDPTVNGGYGYFTDSENNGPWSTALVTEFIPYVEALLGVGGSAASRFLEGYSSGGWAAVWLQVAHPTFFRSVWAVSPDPLDFRHFYEVDVTPGSTDSFYAQRNGAPRWLDREHDVTMRRFMQHVDDDPARGGLISSYEFAWSPRGADGLPLRLFDRTDGSLDERTLEAWHAFDVHAVLDAGGPALEEALAGKLHLYCGSDDDFFYDQPTAALCRFLRQRRYAAACAVVPGLTHGSILGSSSLDPLGVRHLILVEAARIRRRDARAINVPRTAAPRRSAGRSRRDSP
ncbi:MAG TPA: alpha/beta hydrolase-fold protein [Candidatus Binatia bacterium]|nr:alpha/beta hydrolase-fold protein [Candidatus Binatia bacterium]